jgi:hypothetical protein
MRRARVIDLLQTRRWTPGDVYYACAGRGARPSHRYVVDMYEADRGVGWGAIAQRLGIKPGSPEFHRLKKGFVPTYDRWARPIDLDDDLRREYPNRGKGKPATRGKSTGKGPAPAAQGKGNPAKGKPSGHGADAHGGKPEAKGVKKGKGNGKE